MFVRVTEIPSEGVWRVDVGDQTTSFGDLEAALAHARSTGAGWIEVGQVRGGRHHWTTLRRGEDGEYGESPLRWGGRT